MKPQSSKELNFSTRALWRRVALAGFVFILMAQASTRVEAASNLLFGGGPVMVNPVRVFIVYWLPPGVVLDTSVSNGVGNFETTLQSFVVDLAGGNLLSGSDYLNIVTQYPGTCGGQSCVLNNKQGAVVLGGTWVDNQNAYPHPQPNSPSGTQSNPLQDSDIQNEITTAISNQKWTIDANSIVFVVTGVFQGATQPAKPVEECTNNGVNCTFKGSPNGICAYHYFFPSGGANIIYSYLSDANFNVGGCQEGLNAGVDTGAHNQLASDQEVSLMSHELFESITDPLSNAWVNSTKVNNITTNNEIGDLCNQLPAFVNLNFHPYNVELIWSNASSSCVKNYGHKTVTVSAATDYLLSSRDTDLAGVRYLLEKPAQDLAPVRYLLEN
jgi:hypothetical protein